MTSPSTHTHDSRPARRLRSRIAASAAAITMSGIAVVGVAAPAHAMPRSCEDIANTMMFFDLAMALDVGPYARYYARDERYWNQNMRAFESNGC